MCQSSKISLRHMDALSNCTAKFEDKQAKRCRTTAHGH
jgi:hypothetical protein